MSDRSGLEGPPPEAYSRVTNPERFAPLLDIAVDVLDRLEREFDVTREEGYGLDARLENDPSRPTVRLIPTNPEAGSLTVGFTRFPGVLVRVGHWFVFAAPHCGCDACDETVEEGEGYIERAVEALTTGRFSESVSLPLIGAGRYYNQMPHAWGRGRLERADAKAWIERAGGQARFEYSRWQPRATRHSRQSDRGS